MKIKKIKSIIFVIIMATLLMLALAACSNDDASTEENPDPQTDAVTETGTRNETEPDIQIEDISVEVEELALTVGEFSGMVSLSRPLQAYITHHFNTTVTKRIPVFAWDEGSGHEVPTGENEEIDIVLNGDFEGTERIVLLVRSGNGDTVGSAIVGLSSGDHEIDSQSWTFAGYLGDSLPAGTYTLYLLTVGFEFDTSNIPELVSPFFYMPHTVDTYYDLPIMEFEYNPALLAVECDYITVGGALRSPYTIELHLSGSSLDSDVFLGLSLFKYLKRLELQYNQISDISPLAGLTNLTSLNLRDNKINDISPLTGLVNLTSLNLCNNQISDITPVFGLPKLESLDLSDMRTPSVDGVQGELIRSITDLTQFAGFTNLNELRLSNHLISDVSPLANLTNLTELKLGDNKISDITPLAGLTNLESLDLDRQREEHIDDGGRETFLNTLSDLSPLAGLTNLTSLNLDYNDISDITPLGALINLNILRLTGGDGISDITALAGLTNLTSLHLGSNEISDLSPLTNLTNLESLHLNNNEINDITPLASITNLESLYLNSNEISGISPLTDLTNLKSLDLNSNEISDLSPLAGLINLTSLDLHYQGIYDEITRDFRSTLTDITALAELTNLNRLNLTGNEITDWSPVSHVENVNGRP